jgi:hypothetical protein
MKALAVCPNGERITPREKLVGMVLADSHQDKARRFTYPSVETIAEESMSDRRTCQRYLSALERKGVIRRLRPSNQGRGAQVFYFFPALEELPEGWQDAALSVPDVFCDKGGGRAAEGRRKGGNLRAALIERAQEREHEQVQQEQHPPTPLARGESGGKENDDANDRERKDREQGTGNREQDAAGSYAPEKSAASVDLAAMEVQTPGLEVSERQTVGSELGDGESDSKRDVGSARSGVDAGGETAEAGADLDGVADEPLDDLEIAVTAQVVMIGCGWTDEKLRPIIVAQLDMQEQSGEGLVETSQKMIAAWKLYKQQGSRLRFKWGARKFIGEGYWSNSESWPWDAMVLREERLRANARVGSYTPP